MAASPIHEVSATELELKRRGRRRLIGAITIGLLAFVFLPMIFDNEPKRSGQAAKSPNISVLVPAKEGQPALAEPTAQPVSPPVSPAIPATNSDAARATAPVGVEPAKSFAADTGKAAAVPAVATAGTVEPAKPAKKVEKPAKAETATTTPKSGFVVQLGVFADTDNAKLAVAKMKEAKLVVFTESIPIKSGNATRVRVGPFATKEKADAALAQVKLAGADGKIVPLK